MIVTLKNLQQKTFTIEIDDQCSVLDLKKEIFNKLGGDYLVEKQKLIYSGAILSDDRSLASYNVDEKKFIVVMLTQPVAANAPAANQSNNVEVNENSPVENVQAATQLSNEPSNQPSTDIESTFVMGEEYNRTIDVLMEMGFSRESVENAMAAGFNNPERAFEYLVNGIPDQPDSEGSTEGSDFVGANAIREVLEILRQNPALLSATLQRIGLNDPNLVQQISDNPDAFINLLNQSMENQGNAASPQTGLNQIAGNLSQMLQTATNRQEAATNSIESTSGSNNLSSLPVPLTRGDKDSIERIKAMGFSEARVLQAYIACDKNEELTINFLLSNSDE